MSDIVLIAGPPASAALWGGVAARLARHGHVVSAFDLFDPVPADGSVEGISRRLYQHLAERRDPVLVAHGSAVPAAWLAAASGAVSALVLTNGPVVQLDPVLAALSKACAVPELAARTWLRPGLLQGWLSSSAGLRRTVVNPYVMDRDTVVAISESWLKSAAHRASAARYLRGLGRIPLPLPPVDVPTLLLWGDADPLYPSADADQACRLLPSAVHRAIPGGQHFHPEERPWELADQLDAWLAERTAADLTAT